LSELKPKLPQPPYVFTSDELRQAAPEHLNIGGAERGRIEVNL